MLEIANLVLGILGLVSTWRFFVCAVTAIGASLLVAHWVPEGVSSYLFATPLLAMGVIGGAIWQTRYERRRKLGKGPHA